jgi:hypothetical protein
VKRTPKPRDAAQRAFAVVADATGEAAPASAPKDPAAVARGKVGGAARASKLTPEERSEVARMAALARWSAKKAHVQNKANP